MKNQYSYSIGIDISKDTFTVKFLGISLELKPSVKAQDFKNNKVGFKQFLKKVKNLGIINEKAIIVMEATGVYWERLAYFCYEKGFNVNVANPAQIKHFSRTILRRGKTDAIDAEMIAKYGALMETKLWYPPSNKVIEIKQTIHQRNALVSIVTQENNRLHALNHSAHVSKRVISICKKHIKVLKAQIEELNQLLKEIADKDKDLEAKVKLLKSIPGVSYVTAYTLIGETKGLSTFISSKQLAAYTGISPCPNQSGSVTKRARISKIGNSGLRKTIYMSALVGVKHNPVLKRFYERLRKNGKCGKVALVASARKLLSIIYGVINSGKPFDPEYISVKPCHV